MNDFLNTIGCTDFFLKQAQPLQETNQYYLGRICAQYPDLYRVLCEDNTLMAVVSGKLRHGATSPAHFPAVGDFVLVDRPSDQEGYGIIHHVLQRKTVFARKSAGNTQDTQVVAANIDTVFLCMAMNNDFNLRRLERYLAIAWESGATPVVVLTKIDLCDNLETRLLEVEAIAMGVDILTTSALSQEGYATLLPYLKTGKTIAFLGSSGVGKSTLINCLMGQEKIPTQGLRNDHKGRHTTTGRELFLLDTGAMVMDTPGMRELGVAGTDLSQSFADIETLATQCRFNDCSHTKEPHCAVQEAIQTGTLTQERLESYEKLQRESQYATMGFKERETTKLNQMFQEVGGLKNARKYMRQNDKRN